MIKTSMFSLLIGVTLLAFGPSHVGADDNAPHDYQGKGVIVRIADDKHTVTIHHQDIPGYMMSMTMDFPVHDAHLLEGLAAGDKIDFTLHVTRDDAWVTGIHATGQKSSGSTNTAPASAESPPVFKPGEVLPDAAFLAEDGRQVHLSDYRGKVVILTFFFTRCPLPNYCPLMNRNFAATRELLLADPKAPKSWQFLSVSFDAQNDQPQTLASFADAYRRRNADRWLFVSAPPETLRNFAAPLGLMVMRQGDSLSHNLRTVVIDPRQRLFRQFNDNAWTPQQLAEAIAEAAKAPASA
jgi:protein SCO1/2